MQGWWSSPVWVFMSVINDGEEKSGLPGYDRAISFFSLVLRNTSCFAPLPLKPMDLSHVDMETRKKAGPQFTINYSLRFSLGAKTTEHCDMKINTGFPWRGETGWISWRNYPYEAWLSGFIPMGPLFLMIWSENGTGWKNHRIPGYHYLREKFLVNSSLRFRGSQIFPCAVVGYIFFSRTS